ncbi:MAG: methyltransferase domain-containing protein [Chloroflexaceae bacterium]|nr:methyltransferase domain-containing protein [Chloroflexaceae bacterium]
MKRQPACPCCDSSDVTIFYETGNVPVHSVLLLPTREEAIHYPTGTVRLGFCRHCGFVSNVAFDADLQHEYAERYEETQGFSSTFNAFSRRLAADLVERYQLRNKQIIEIGCGKGEFLTLLCQLGDNRGVGFDPGYVRERSLSQADERVVFVRDFFSEKYADYQADFICCKMTLEHIARPFELLQVVKRMTASTPDTVVFFQVPDVTRILQDAGFWDIYYEHCSYFSPGSIARLFRRAGFEVLNLRVDYGGQYLMIEAGSASGQNRTSRAFPELENDLDNLAALVEAFPAAFEHKRAFWKETLRHVRNQRRRAVLWGSGSKGVAFLTTLGVRDEIAYTVDINPHKHGTYMAGTGQQIVPPVFLKDYRPDLVIIMNPVYREEIQHDLDEQGLAPEIIAVS